MRRLVYNGAAAPAPRAACANVVGLVAPRAACTNVVGLVGLAGLRRCVALRAYEPQQVQRCNR